MTEQEKKEAAMTPMERAERSIIKKFKKGIWRKFTCAINEYQLIQDGDVLGVPLFSEAKSFLLMKELEELLKHGIQNFTFVTYEVPRAIGEPRDRREKAISEAKNRGCTKVLFTECFDDIIEAIVMNVLYAAKVETIMPRETIEGIEIIRPLYLTKNADIEHWVSYNELTFSESFEMALGKYSAEEYELHLQQKLDTRVLLAGLAKENKYVPMNVFRSVENINLATLTGYIKDGEQHSFLDTYH